MAIEIETVQHPDSRKMSIMATFDQEALGAVQMVEFIIGEIGRLVAERYVEENYGELVGKMDQQAIANLAIADAGKKIAEEIRLKPTVVRERETRTEVYQRGLLGGVKRVR